jgi:CRP-like cAMP-binding protein
MHRVVLPGPSLRAVPFHHAHREPVQLLSEAQRAELARHAHVRTIPARTFVYHAGAKAVSAFMIGEGVVKSFRELPSGRRRIAAFWFAGDVFGLAEAGRYVNSTQTITPVRLYEIDVVTLTGLFRHDGDLEYRFLCKVFHVLREAQHHNVIVGRRDAAGRLAMLLMLLLQQNGQPYANEVAIPMTRSDIANYLGLTLEAVVRAARRLELQGIVQFVARRQARILDRGRFEALVSHV